MKKRTGNGRRNGTPKAMGGYVLTEKGRAYLAQINSAKKKEKGAR